MSAPRLIVGCRALTELCGHGAITVSPIEAAAAAGHFTGCITTFVAWGTGPQTRSRWPT
jgi:hypothetical protein